MGREFKVAGSTETSVAMYRIVSIGFDGVHLVHQLSTEAAIEGITIDSEHRSR